MRFLLLVAIIFLPWQARAADPDPGPSMKMPRPVYPYEAYRRHQQGNATLRVTTDQTGHVAKTTVVKSSGSEILDKASIAFARANWSGPPNKTFREVVEYKLGPKAK